MLSAFLFSFLKKKRIAHELIILVGTVQRMSKNNKTSLASPPVTNLNDMKASSRHISELTRFANSTMEPYHSLLVSQTFMILF